MIDFQFDNDNMTGTIRLCGKLTIENIPQIKKSFIEALTKTDNLILDHTAGEEFDFSYLQLLVSFVKTSESLNKKFSVLKGCPENFRNLIIKSGLADISLFSRTFLN